MRRLADPADLVAEACGLLAGYLPVLARYAPEPDEAAFAAPGMTARPSAAPLPGNPAVLYALTGIHASARNLEGVLLYNAGKRRPGPLAARGGSDANTLAALDAISRLIAKADDDLYRLVISELEQRLDETRSVAAIDEAQRWRHIRGRQCRYCGCWFLKVLLDRAGGATRHVECFGHREDGVPCRAAATVGTDEHGVFGLCWPDFTETVPDLEEP